MIYILSILFTLMFVLYSKWQFSDDWGLSSGKWHPYGMIMRVLAVITPFLCQLYPGTWSDYLLSGAINVVLWELGINVIALNKPLFYIGSTAEMDIKLGYKKWLLYFGFLLVAIVVRILY